MKRYVTVQQAAGMTVPLALMAETLCARLTAAADRVMASLCNYLLASSLVDWQQLISFTIQLQHHLR